MEQLASAAYNPHILRVLKSYQTAAMQSLSGPSSHLAAWGTDPAKMDLEQYRKALATLLKKDKTEVFDPVFTLRPYPIQQMPGLCLPLDPSRSEKSETVLEGLTISCFMVGGERRLCLPQILNTVLREFTLQQINIVCDELHIFCSRCNPEQLETLKVAGILPVSAPSCGLITKTDAERLCNALLHKNPEKSREPPTPNCFLVYHECFGKCKGLFNPDLYIDPYAKCIECMDCHGMFSPQKFVCHSHKALENRTCHWGFDSANWRAYLLLAKEQSHIDALQRTLDDIKARFDFTSRFKRKQSPLTSESKDVSKRSRSSQSPENVQGTNLPCEDSVENNQLRLLSAFRPWSPSSTSSNNTSRPEDKGSLSYDRSKGLPSSFSNQEPPVLLNPEKVVPHDADLQRSEPLFAPNVALAPPEFQKKSTDDNHKFPPSQPQACNPWTHIDEDEEDFEVNVSSDTEDEDDFALQSSSSSGLSTPKDNISFALSRSAEKGDIAESEDMKVLSCALESKNQTTMKTQVERLFQDMQQKFKEQIKELKESNSTLEKKYQLLREKYIKLALTNEDQGIESDAENTNHEDTCKQLTKYKGKVAVVPQCLDQNDTANTETSAENESSRKRRSPDPCGKEPAKLSRVSPTKLQENGLGSPAKAANLDNISEKAPSPKKCESPGSKHILAKS